MHVNHSIFKRLVEIVFVCGCATSVTMAWAGEAVQQSINPENGLKSWSYEGDGLSIELVQVPPDFIRASYSARGLPTQLIEMVATRCVFGTIVRNLADRTLSYRVTDWHYVNEKDERLPIKSKSEWLKEWHSMGMRFSWSILADEPTFEVGDWLQGFTTMAEPHGSRLSLNVVWSIEGTRYEQNFPQLECAPPPDE